MYKGISIKQSEDFFFFSAETLQARRDWHDIFKMLKEKKKKTFNQEYSTQQTDHLELYKRQRVFQTSKH